MTLRSVAELLWAMGWEPEFATIKVIDDPTANDRETSAEAEFDNAPPKVPRLSTKSDGNAEFELVN